MYGSYSRGSRRRASVIFVAIACSTMTGLIAHAASVVEISGQPPPSVKVGDVYRFRPTTIVQGPDFPRFSIENKPRWATFDMNWGRLEGSPTRADVGRYDSIRIIVSAGTTRAALPAFSILVPANPGSNRVTLQWTPPTTFEDGTGLDGLAGYRLYWGQRADALKSVSQIRNAGSTSYFVDWLRPGANYFALTALTFAGAESELSALVLVPGPAP